jgi:hypothetical protein
MDNRSIYFYYTILLHLNGPLCSLILPLAQCETTQLLIALEVDQR